MIRLTNVIATYNRKELLQGHLEALVDQSLPRTDWEVIVVDDGSDDGTEDVMAYIADYTPYALRYIRLRKDGWGGSRARNTGIREARGEIIVLNDDDCIPSTNQFLEVYAKTCQPGVVVTGWNYEIDHMVWGMHFHPYSYFLPRNAAVHKTDLRRVGLFAEDLTIYGFEDVELGVRLHLAGCIFVYCRSAKVDIRADVQYNNHPMSLYEKAVAQRQAWDWFERQYADAGIDWPSLWREDGRHREFWARLGQPPRR